MWASFLLPAALAAAPVSEVPPARSGWDPPLDMSIGLRGVGEVWRDGIIAQHFRSSRFAGTGVASVGLLPVLMGQFELGYMRQGVNPNASSTALALELVPTSLVLLARTPGDGAQVFGGGGLALTSYNLMESTQAISGTKVGLEMRGGIWVPTGLIQPSMRPGSKQLQDVDFELFVGHRAHQLFGTPGGRGGYRGFNLSAWRVGAGLVLRL